MKASNKSKLTPEALELVAARFRALSETARLRLIMALKSGEKSVTELVDETALSQANASRHLQHLSNVGILSRRKEGLQVLYSIADRSIFNLCEQVCGSVEEVHEKRVRAFRR